MTWPPDIAGELPAPRDDEPRSLRQDIADELADHLQAAFSRELHFTPEESAAKQTVLDRFGDPRRVARQLWFDAMKERIMSQRLLLAALVVVLVACLGSTGLTWLLVEQSRQANQALLAQSQAANDALLEKLAALALPASTAPAAEAPRSMEWNPIKVRLVTEHGGEAPPTGYQVRLHGYLLDTAKQIEITRKTGADGVADLGVVRPGQHSLTITTPWNETRSSASITVLPGMAHVEEIVCPAADVREGTVRFSIDWPENLKGKNLALVCTASAGSREIGGSVWYLPAAVRNRTFIVTARNAVIVPQFEPDPQRGPRSPLEVSMLYRGLSAKASGLFANPAVLMRPFGGPVAAPAAGAAVQPAKSPSAPSAENLFEFGYLESARLSELKWPALRFTVENILVAESPADKAGQGAIRLGVLGGLISRYQGLSQHQMQPDSQLISDWIDTSGIDPRVDAGLLRTKEQPVLDVKSGQTNQFKLSLPPRLLENLAAAHSKDAN